MKQNCSL